MKREDDAAGGCDREKMVVCAAGGEGDSEPGERHRVESTASRAHLH